MSLELCVLGSGSSGNATLVRLGERLLLIDAGFGPRAVARRLAGTGVGLDDIDAILLTHLDRDHFAPSWHGALLKHEIPLHVARSHVDGLYRTLRRHRPAADPRLLQRAGLLRIFDDQPFELTLRATLAGRVHPVRLDHDQRGTTGYVIDTGRHRLGFATDLGHVPPALETALTDVDLLAIESNYDPAMEAASDRPDMLKRRVMGRRGHLSNDEASRLVRRIFARSQRPPRHVVLLHLSRQCNCPNLLRELYAPYPPIARRLRLTSQTEPTGWLSVNEHEVLPGEQMSMFA
jgi:phosphoribosyl 1,2-cyclic phosphodiesterase